MTIIMNGERYMLKSFGNGLAYALIDKKAREDVYVQGDDASTMRDEIDAIEGMREDWSTDAVLGWLWDQCDYGSVAKAMVL